MVQDLQKGKERPQEVMSTGIKRGICSMLDRGAIGIYKSINKKNQFLVKASKSFGAP